MISLANIVNVKNISTMFLLLYAQICKQSKYPDNKNVYGPSSRPSVRDTFKVMYHNKTIRMYFIIIEKTTNSVY